MGIAKVLLEALYPPTCPICDIVVEKPAAICPDCRKKLHYIHSPRCLKCGKPVEAEETELCFDCQRKPHEFYQGAALWTYTEETRQSIYRFKYENCRIYSEVYGEELVKHLGSLVELWKGEALIPVPIHARKQRQRGFNQAQLLAEAAGRALNLPVDAQLLKRSRYTRPQKELDDSQRRKNLEKAFIIEKNVVQYKRIILVDDIYTTGATIDACARALKEKGVERVYFLCLCIGRGF